MEMVIEHTEMVGNRRECHGKAGEQWRRSEKIRYMTVFPSKGRTLEALKSETPGAAVFKPGVFFRGR